MSKFCTNCGSALEDQALFCTNCGVAVGDAPVEAAPVEAAPVEAAPVEAAPVEAAPVEAAPAGKPQLNFKLIGIAAGVLAVVIILSCIIFPMLLPSPESAIDNMIAAMEGKESKVESLLPDSIWEYLEDEIDDFDMDDLAEEFAEYTLESLERQYGEDIRISYDVEKKTALKEKKLEDIAEELADAFDIDEDDVKEGYKMKVSMSIEGDEDEDEDEEEMTVIKIGNKWYIYEMISTIVSFAKYYG